MIIRIIAERPNEYTYSAYKKGWVLEVIEDFGKYYTAMVLTGTEGKTSSVIAVHKNDCESINLHKDITEINDEQIWMVT